MASHPVERGFHAHCNPNIAGTVMGISRILDESSIQPKIRNNSKKVTCHSTAGRIVLGLERWLPAAWGHRMLESSPARQGRSFSSGRLVATVERSLWSSDCVQPLTSLPDCRRKSIASSFLSEPGWNEPVERIL
jgi:hypothetical protein